MIIDHRTYELQPGRVRQALLFIEGEEVTMQTKHLGHLVGYFTTEGGNVNEIVHIWAYQDLAESRDFMKTMNNKILVPTSFSPTK